MGPRKALIENIREIFAHGKRRMALVLTAYKEQPIHRRGEYHVLTLAGPTGSGSVD